MGVKNAAMVNWLSDAERFADLFNVAVCRGRQTFSAEQLVEQDSDMALLLKDRDGKLVELRRTRDMIRMAQGDARMALLAVELQDKIHYAMAVRVMLEDAMNYARQVRDAERRHKAEKDAESADEFLSGWSKEDRLIPCLTIVLYHGTEAEWDAAQNLQDMFAGSEEWSDEMRSWFADYPVHVVCVNELAQMDGFQSDLKWAFGMMRYRDDLEAMQKYVNENRDFFEKVDLETYEALRIMLGGVRKMKPVKEVIKKAKTAKDAEKGNGVDMCKALDDLYNNGVEKGIEQGIERGIEQGIERGIEQGIDLNLIELIQKKVRKGKSLAQTADEVECAADEIAAYYEMVQKYPDKTPEEIYALA